MSKGDYCEVVVDVGAGATKTVKVEATRQGRRIRQRRTGAFTLVEEMTHTGKVVRQVKFQTARLVLTAEYIALTAAAAAPRRRPAGEQVELMDALAARETIGS